MTAHRTHRTLFASRTVRQTDHLSVPHQILVYVHPPVFGSYSHQFGLRVAGILCFDQSHQIGYPVNMGIDAHRRDAHRVCSYAGGRFSSDHRQLQQRFGILRYAAPVFVPQYLAALYQRFRFLLRESGGTYQDRNFVGIPFRQLLDGIIFSEKSVGGLSGVVVLRPLGQDRCHQHVERVRLPFRVQTFRRSSWICSFSVFL
jgi:hypothetical protein